MPDFNYYCSDMCNGTLKYYRKAILDNILEDLYKEVKTEMQKKHGLSEENEKGPYTDELAQKLNDYQKDAEDEFNRRIVVLSNNLFNLTKELK